MDIHNVSLYNYPDGQQIRIYKKPVISGYNVSAQKTGG